MAENLNALKNAPASTKAFHAHGVELRRSVKHFKEAAQAEVDFLKSLLPAGEQA